MRLAENLQITISKMHSFYMKLEDAKAVILEVGELLHISTSIWVLPTPNAGRNSHFQRFLQSTSILVQT